MGGWPGCAGAALAILIGCGTAGSARAQDEATPVIAVNADDPQLMDVNQLSLVAMDAADAGRWADAEAAGRDWLARAREIHGSRSPEIVYALEFLAAAQDTIAAYPLAIASQREAVDIYRESLGPHDADFGQAAGRLAVLLERRGQVREAILLREEEVAAYRASYVVADRQWRSPVIADGLDALGMLLLREGELARAEPALVEALDIRRAVFGDNGEQTASSLANLAALRRAQGRPAEADTLSLQAVNLMRAEAASVAAVLGEGGAMTPIGTGARMMEADALARLARTMEARRDHAGAVPLWGQVVEMTRRVRGDAHEETAEALWALAEAIRMAAATELDPWDERARYIEAAPIYREALGVWMGVWCPAGEGARVRGANWGETTYRWDANASDCRGSPSLISATARAAQFHDSNVDRRWAGLRLFRHAGDMTIGRNRLRYARDAEARLETRQFLWVHRAFIRSAWQ